MSENRQDKRWFLRPQNIGYLGTMGLLFLILGLIISTQAVRHISANNNNLPVERQLNGLVALLKETQNKKSDLEKQLTRLKQQVRTLSRDSMSPGLSTRQFQALYQIAGLTAVKGEGVIIKIDDKTTDKTIINSDSINNDGLVHSEDLLKIVNELKASGAKAVAINDQRLVTISEIVTAGNSILVNQSKIFPPYHIKAIGPTDTMVSALKMRGGIVEYLEVFGIKINIEKKPDLSIPAYDKSFS